jgi:uncharacterized repeat protein (TIGR03803 family)
MLTLNRLLAKPRVAVLFALLTFASGALLSAQTERTVFLFNGGAEGGSPQAGLIADSSGALYGTTPWGGNTQAGYWGGTVFKLTPPSAPGSAWTEDVLYMFQGGNFNDDATNPYCTLVFDSAGNLYGTTEHGGQYEAGTIFQLVPPAAPGGAWTENILYSGFSGYYFAGLVIDSAGNLYGATFGGEVFQLVPPSAPGGTWTYNVLAEVGEYMTSSLIMDGKGNLYGTTQQSGHYNAGLVFGLIRPTTAGDPWTQVDIFSFKNGTDDAFTPISGLTLKSGVLYGTTLHGGAFKEGTVYSVTPPAAPGSPWTENVLYSFEGSGDGSAPEGGVVFGNGGDLYGTTFAGGGSYDLGMVYKLTPPSAPGDPWTETNVHSFTGIGRDGGRPMDTLLLLHGAFFGTGSSPSTVFEVSQ